MLRRINAGGRCAPRSRAYFLTPERDHRNLPEPQKPSANTDSKMSYVTQSSSKL